MAVLMIFHRKFHGNVNKPGSVYVLCVFTIVVVSAGHSGDVSTLMA